MDTSKFLSIVIDRLNQIYKQQFGKELRKEDWYVVWYCKTLQNNKALLATPEPDDAYFEVTYNGDKEEFYYDTYIKKSNVPVKL